LLLWKKWKVVLSERQIIVLDMIQNFSIVHHNRYLILLALKWKNLLILILPWILLTHIQWHVLVYSGQLIILNLAVLYVVYLLLMNRLEAIIIPLKRFARLLLFYLVLNKIIIVSYLLCTRINLVSQIFIME
jgi:hypothetical protein